MSANTPTSTDRPFVCPRCQTVTTLANIRCPNCGANLALAVARAAREMLTATDAHLSVHYEADKFLPRFGEFLMRQGDISAAQLDAALERQKSGSGQHRTVGQILLEMGAVNREQLDQASVAQVKEIQNLLRQSQADAEARGQRVRLLEGALADSAQLNVSSVDFLETVSERLRTAIDKLNGSDAAVDLAEPIGDLSTLAAELSRFTARDR